MKVIPNKLLKFLIGGPLNADTDISLKNTLHERFIDRLKKGSKIHIKEKNKGTFTKYCGGNVTLECIRKGMSSPNPKTRARARFANVAKNDWNK